MKGIAHFAVGVAAASCFPFAVEAGAAGQPLYFVLGGVFGLLPDTIDFKFARFFAQRDIEVVPDPKAPDPQMIADAVACAFNRAAEEDRPCTIRLNTIRLGADMWQSYEVRFDVPGREVLVRLGPVVDTGGTPVESGRATGAGEGRAALAADVALDYEAVTRVDILEGPSFRMEPAGQGRVIPRFIPWHRHWTHSFTVSAAAAVGGAILWGAWAGGVIMAAWSAHVALDQLGFLGSNLFFPFTRARAPGRGIMHSSEPWPNALTVWSACLLIFWNLYRGMPAPPFSLDPLRLFVYGIVLPVAVYAVVRRRRRPVAG